MNEPDTGTDRRDLFLDSTVTLLIEGGTAAVDADAICAAAGLGRDEYDRSFDSVESVYVAITVRLLDSHVDNSDGVVDAAGSPESALRAAFRGVWDLLEERIDEHHAMYTLMLGQVHDPGLRARMGFSLYDTHLRIAERWLAGVERKHGIRWSVPIDRLAVLVQATVTGLMLDFIARRDGDEVREILDLFAGHLAVHAIPV